MVPFLCDKNNCCSGFFPSRVKYFTKQYCDSTKCNLVIGVEASSKHVVSGSWMINVLAAMLLSLTVQALLKEKNKALCKEATCATQWEFQASVGFFYFSLSAKVRVPFAWFRQIPPPPTEVVPVQSETSTECPALRAVLPAGPSHCTALWKSAFPHGRMVQLYIGFVIISGNKGGWRGCFETQQVGITPVARWCW